jgi:propionyl-CoA synthetase
MPPESKTYAQQHARSLADPDGFWSEAAQGIDWSRKWERILDTETTPSGRWFPGARLNTCYNALDRHVEGGAGDRIALVYDSPVTDTRRNFSYRELCDEVARFAGALAGLGIERSDRVLIYMPMIPESVIAMLACARIGAIHSVVFGGFASPELATRIDDARPKVILSASCGVEPTRVIPYQPLLERALELSVHAPDHCVVLQREQAVADLVSGRDHDWRKLSAAAEPVGCIDVEATDPLYILYTSGTTGIPKGVVRDNGGHAVALHWSLENVYGIRPGDVFWAASDIGWVVGHSYIVYAPLLAGCTTILYEGKPVGTPDAGAFWRVISEHGVNALFTAPTAIRAIKRDDPKVLHLERYDISSLRTLFLAGERADPNTVEWAEQALGVPVIDHWWQTETGWPIASNCIGIEALPVKHGSPTVPVPGYDIRVLDDESGNELPRAASSESDDIEGATGSVVLKLPLPPGCLPTLWDNEEGFREAYLSRFPGFYQTADAGYIDADGYVFIMSRTDDIINVAGHRLSTGGMEEVLAGHPDVAECAVIGVQDPLKGQVPLGFAVLKAGASNSPEELERELVRRVRDRIGPVAAFKQVCVIGALPKTRSGKILRSTMRKIADSEEYRVPATIEDASVLDAITDALRAAGFAK